MMRHSNHNLDQVTRETLRQMERMKEALGNDRVRDGHYGVVGPIAVGVCSRIQRR